MFLGSWMLFQLWDLCGLGHLFAFLGLRLMPFASWSAICACLLLPAARLLLTAFYFLPSAACFLPFEFSFFNF